MGMSLHVTGFRPPDAEWQQMKTVWDACKAAGVFPPDEVERFFDGSPPDPAGVEVDLDEHLSEYRDEMQEGYQLAVADIPNNVTVLRFYASY